ncbi:Undecaprenyl-phosphate 4-deoxy-4-formamido-L-arabinose transferase [Rothia kristinae]|nr:Undecaprenyl-phosphate 4-deoxy-4-formamido-L-arabinose transferase [Rothia kristinae]
MTEHEPTADVAVRASVIIPTRGGRDRLHHPLDALQRQSIDDFEVIVVVDGDVDDTAGLLETYRREGMTRLRSIVFPENRGRSAALNAGFDAARGDILIRCDDDLEPGAEYVQRHLEAHPARTASPGSSACTTTGTRRPRMRGCTGAR